MADIGSVFILQIADAEDLKTSVEQLKQDKGISEAVLIGSTSDNKKKTVAGYLVWLFRCFGIHRNERETVLSEEDQTIAAQLCLAQMNEILGEFDVEVSKVIHSNKMLTEARATATEDELDTELNQLNEKYRNYKKMCNLVDLLDVLFRVEAEMKENEALQKEIKEASFILTDNVQRTSDVAQKKMLNLLTKDKKVYKVTAEIPLEDTSDLKLEYNETCLILESATGIMSGTTPRSTPRSIRRTPKTPAASRISVTEQYVEKIFHSYLQMLVNTRCEISLARIINVPDRDLDHKAFTDVKHAATQKNMPMYQMIASHIMRIRLGGKSYAPDPNSPMSQHVKGLSELTDFVHKLQTVMEEEPNTKSSIKRIINIIKNCIAKHRDNTLRKESIISVAERLQDQAEICLQHVTTSPSSPPKSNSKGGSMLGIQVLKTIRTILDRQAGNLTQTTSIEYLSDMVSSQRTPLRFPSVLSKFRSPIEVSPDEKTKPLAERLMDKLKKPKKAAPARYQSYMDWVTPAQSMNFNRDQNEPIQITDFTNSKTIIHPAEKVKSSLTAKKVLESINDQENIENPGVSSETSNKLPLQQQKPNVPRAKRKADTAEQAEPRKKKCKPATTKSKKKIPQIPSGQKQLTAFFRL